MLGSVCDQVTADNSREELVTRHVRLDPGLSIPASILVIKRNQAIQGFFIYYFRGKNTFIPQLNHIIIYLSSKKLKRLISHG